jgi:hypothetical protein
MYAYVFQLVSFLQVSTPNHVPISTPNHVPVSTPNHVPISRPNHVPLSTPNHVPISTPNYVPDSTPNHVPISRLLKHCQLATHLHLVPRLRMSGAVTYRVSREECKKLRESVPYVKIFRYNPKHLCPKLNGYGDNGQRSLKL